MAHSHDLTTNKGNILLTEVAAGDIPSMPG